MVVTAWKRNAENILPSSAPTTHAAIKNGIIVVIPVALKVIDATIRKTVVHKRKKKGIIGYIKATPSTFAMKIMLLSM